MAFNDFELAESGGKPVELYEFTIGVNDYQYTSANIDYVVAGKTWVAVDGLDHSDISQTGENRDDVAITMPHNHFIPEQFSTFVMVKEIMLTIYAVHEDDGAQELVHLYTGRVSSRKLRFPRAELTVKSIDAEIARTVLAPSYGPDCQHSQYDGHCSLLESTWEEAATISSMSGRNIFVGILGSHPTDHFKGGQLVTTEGYRAWIRSHDTLSVEIDRDLPDMVVGNSITLLPACRGEFARCDTVFSNKDSFLGAPHANVINPFLGDGVEGDQ